MQKSVDSTGPDPMRSVSAWTSWWPQNTPDIFRQASEYWIDAWQRSVLFLDVLRQRGNQHIEYMARKDPNVLNFQFEIVMDGAQICPAGQLRLGTGSLRHRTLGSTRVSAPSSSSTRVPGTVPASVA